MKEEGASGPEEETRVKKIVVPERGYSRKGKRRLHGLAFKEELEEGEIGGGEEAARGVMYKLDKKALKKDRKF